MRLKYPEWAVCSLEHLTAEVVRRHFGAAVSGPVTRSEILGLPALVFRIPGILGGGVTSSTALDGHGKTLSYHLLAPRAARLKVRVPYGMRRHRAY